MGRLSIHDLAAMKQRGEKVSMLTAYDYPTAKLVERAGVPIILVGDSLGMVVLGYDSTIPVTLDDIIHHTKAVVRGTERAIIVADMPFLSFQVTPEEALRNAGRLLRETGCTAVKLEGGAAVAPTVRRLVEAGIPVMGHVGLTPQSANQLGGFKLQARTAETADKLIDDVQALEAAGAFAIVLETIPAPVAKRATELLTVPTIGIGAGPYCDGQVQVLYDFLGLAQRAFSPRHVKEYAKLGDVITEAVGRYIAEVQGGEFPTAKHSFGMGRQATAATEPAASEEIGALYGGGR